MGEENLILLNWQEQVKAFQDNLTRIRKRTSKNVVHDLRVAIKKMRSYLRLKKKMNREKWKKLFSGTAALFTSLGKLRDFEMSLALTRKYERKEHLSFISFKQYLSANRNPARRAAKEHAVKYNENELEEFSPRFISFSATLSNEEICKKIILLSGEKKDKVKKLDDHFHYNAHEIRKSLKDIYYWSKICPQGYADDLIDLKGLDKVLNYLGSWQDHFILKEKIKMYRKERLPVDEKELLKSFQRNIIKEQRELLGKAKRKWIEIIKDKGD